MSDEAKRKASLKLQSDTEAFIANGGKIEIIPYNMTGEEYKLGKMTPANFNPHKKHFIRR